MLIVFVFLICGYSIKSINQPIDINVKKATSPAPHRAHILRLILRFNLWRSKYLVVILVNGAYLYLIANNFACHLFIKH